MHHRKLDYVFKLIVNPSLHLECAMLFDIQPRHRAVFTGLIELCLRLLATQCISLPWLCRVFGIAAHLSTVHSSSAIIATA